MCYKKRSTLGLSSRLLAILSHDASPPVEIVMCLTGDPKVSPARKTCSGNDVQ